MTRLVGRDHPARILRAAVERALDSHGGLLLVAGEPGIGKSALVARAAEEALGAGALVLSGTCWEGDGAPGYWPWIQVARALGHAGLPDGTDFELYDGVTTLLVSASRSRPVLLVLEDLHWADPASLRLLEFVVKHAWFERLMVVGTYRDAEVVELEHPLIALQAQATTLTLTGLDRAEVATLITSTTGALPGDDVVSEIFRRTGGNPFFVEQTARLWQGGSPLATIPPGVRAALRRRLSRLPYDVTDLLATAAVLGREFDPHPLTSAHAHHTTPLTHTSAPHLNPTTSPPDTSPPPGTTASPTGTNRPPGPTTPVLEADPRPSSTRPPPDANPATPVRDTDVHPNPGTPLPEEDLRPGAFTSLLDAGPLSPTDLGGLRGVERLLAQAVSAGLVAAIGSDRFAFVHDLVRETLYADLEEADRRARHEAVLRALDHASPTERAAHAYLADSPDAPDLLIAAARDAELRLSAEEAAGHYARALERIPATDPSRRAEVRLDLGIAQHHAGDLATSRRTLDEVIAAVHALDDPELLAHTALRLHNLGGLQPWIDFVRDAHRKLVGPTPDDQPHTEPTTHAVADPHAHTDGDPGTHTGREADEHAGREADEHAGRELSAYAAGLARAAGNDRELGYSLQTRIGAIWGPGTAAERAGLAEELAAVAVRLHNHDLELNAASWLSSALLELGDPRYVEHHHAFVARAEQTGLALFTHEAAVRKTVFATLTGRFDEARHYAAETRAAGEQPHVDGRELNWLQRWSIELLQGRHAEVDALLAEMRTSGSHNAPLLTAATSVHRGERAAAVLHLTEVMATGKEAMRWMRPLWLRFQAQAAALSGDPVLCESARAALLPYRGQWALTATFVVDGPYDHWIAVLDAAQGRWDDAIAGFQAAQEAADRVGASPWSIEARARLAETLTASLHEPATDGREPGASARQPAADAHEPGTDSRPSVAGARKPRASAGEPEAGAGAVTGARASVARARKPGASAGESVAGAGAVAGARELGAEGREPGVGARKPVADAWAPGADLAAQVAGLVGQVAGEAAELGMLVRLPRPGGNAFRLVDGVWTVTYADTTAHLPDAKGLRDLHFLISSPGADVPAVHLLNPAGGQVVIAARSMGGDAVLDDAARNAYRQRLDLLDEEIDRAAELGDDRRAAELDHERQALLDELRTAAGLGGRSRRLGDEAERARKAVTNRIRDTLRRLDQRHPDLAAHLRATVSTGVTCRYQPPTPVEWAL